MRLKNVILGFAIGMFAIACGPESNSRQQPPPVEPLNSTPPSVEHRVTYSGETLALIALWYTGKATNWGLIQEANPGLNPKRISLGQTISIPESLVTRSEPMPRRFISENVRVRSSEPTPTPTDEVAPGGSFEGDLPPDVNTGDELSLDAILKKKIEETEKKVDPAPTPTNPGVTPSPVGTPTPAENKPAPGDAEREQLLDELLTQ